jgi:ABC-2 type transport system ATP-binding protein
VLHGLSFDILRGSVTGLIGPSGGGKTTLMRAIMGVQVVGSLSGGQLHRASLAVALLGRPELLVLDEPTVGLDPELRDELWALFRRLSGRGLTLVVSSHVMDEAARCDRLLLIREGQILADDTPDGLAAAGGISDLDEAFLRLIRSRKEAAA